MNNRIIVTAITVKANCIEVIYCVEGETLLPAFRGLHIEGDKQVGSFFVEYSESTKSVPAGIAVIPFVANVLPIVWLWNAELFVDELDENFYESIPEIEHSYIFMYPMLSFQGKVTVSKLVKYHSIEPTQIDHTASLFSGGVDAFATLFAHYEERPTLITLWGADVKQTDEEGWSKVWGHTTKIADSLSLPTPIWIKTNFREIVDEGYLGSLVKKSKDGWWHGFQHGIGISAHTAPLAYMHGFATIYMASSFNVRYKGTCASDPMIESHLRFADSYIRHDRYSYTRNDKIRLIIQRSKELEVKVPFHVCWQSTGGGNCCSCEKCLRTIMGIIAQGGDPHDFGFDIEFDKLSSYRTIIEQNMSLYPQLNEEWKLLKEAFTAQDLYHTDPRYNWIYDLKADSNLLLKMRSKHALRAILFPLVYFRRHLCGKK